MCEWPLSSRSCLYFSIRVFTVNSKTLRLTKHTASLLFIHNDIFAVHLTFSWWMINIVLLKMGKMKTKNPNDRIEQWHHGMKTLCATDEYETKHNIHKLCRHGICLLSSSFYIHIYMWGRETGARISETTATMVTAMYQQLNSTYSFSAVRMANEEEGERYSK